MHEHHSRRGDARRPECPFCAAPWTDPMLDQFDAMSGSAGCACHPADALRSAPQIVDDLCCARCGRAIYLKPVDASVAASSDAG